jgi:AraC family L-rhamnose operon regulatory protein RhaS
MNTPPRGQPVEATLPPYGVCVFESHHTSNFRMQASRHDFFEVFYVLRGRGRFLIEGRAYPCRAGDTVVVPVRHVHQIEDDPASPLSLYGVRMAPDVWKHDPALTEQIPAGAVPAGGLLANQVRGDLRRLLFEQTLARPGSSTLILGIALQLLGTLLRGSAPRPTGPGPGPGASAGALRQSVEWYVEELQRSFFGTADIDQAAGRLGMSRRRFTQLFREVTGASWSAYLNRLRVEHACRLLEETQRSIVEIAFECGFEELTSFYRAFKRQTGLPPNRWRQRHQAG